MSAIGPTPAHIPDGGEEAETALSYRHSFMGKGACQPDGRLQVKNWSIPLALPIIGNNFNNRTAVSVG
jgi:hypothetical protein